MIKVFYNSTEITNQLKFAMDTAVALTLTTGTNEIEVHSEKPLSRLYWVLNSSHDGSLTSEYFNGTVFTNLDEVDDSTNIFKNQGWITWSVADDVAKDGEYFKYKFTVDGLTVAAPLTINFVGIVFSEDYDLSSEYPNILEYKPSGDSSLARFHIAAKDAIVQWFRGKGKFTMQGNTVSNLTEYDFLNIDEVKNASKFIALAKIMSWLSDAVDDKYYQKAMDYKAFGYSALDVFFLSLDTNSDGKAQEKEKLVTTTLVVTRG
jgi:hypothetical protein